MPERHEKITKRAAGYRAASTSRRTCGNCSAMHNDGTCDRVQGMVSPSMVCYLWTPRRAT